MRLRWSNTQSRSLEFDAGKRAEFAHTLEDAMVSYRQPLAVENRVMCFRRTSSGCIGAIYGDRYWQSQHVWPDLDAVRSAIADRTLYVPPEATVEYRIVDDPRAYIAALRDANTCRIAAGLATVEARGYKLMGNVASTMNATDYLELHVQASLDRWQDPIFPPPENAETIHFPCDYCNGQKTENGFADIQIARQTHVVNSTMALSGGHPAKRVHPQGYHDTPQPTLCGLYWNDWCLKIGPGHWHADAVYDACLSALRTDGQFTGFIADVTENLSET